MKKLRLTILSMLIIAMTLALFTGCGNKAGGSTAGQSSSAGADTAASDSSEATEPAGSTESSPDTGTSSPDITILYTNDVHSYIDNVVKDKDGNVTGDGMRFSKIAAMLKDLREAGENVILVDAGDEIQGSIYGALDQGESVIELMEATGYQLATPGNHDFDYGVLQLLRLVEEADFPYVTCNFHSTVTREIIFADSYTFDIGGKKVAFVGITTPSTFTSSTPTYFQNEKGEYIYTIDGMNDTTDLYTSVQNSIDKARENADYVIALGHLGVAMDMEKKGWDSRTLIANVTGLDAFIDGHSHTTIESESVKDKEGREVPLTQTGSYLNAVGVMKISPDGTVKTSLVSDYDREDDEVARLEKEFIGSVDEAMNEKIGVLENSLYVNNPDNENQRLIRARELNIGDFTADSVYWFFNDRLEINCDVAIQNGGGIRAGLDKGDLTYAAAKQVEPFGNMICLISTTGQQIIDALEMGASVTGEWDEEWDAPAENGGFLHVAGLSYTIDSTIPSSVETDNDGMFVRVNGDYRVRDVKVYNRDSGSYEPIDPDKTYQLGGLNYMLRNSGNGLSMFSTDDLTVDYVGQDYVILSEYIKSFAADGDYPLVNTKNSPLADYAGYQLDYDDPMGAGRINIILE